MSMISFYEGIADYIEKTEIYKNYPESINTVSMLRKFYTEYRHVCILPSYDYSEDKYVEDPFSLKNTTIRNNIIRGADIPLQISDSDSQDFFTDIKTLNVLILAGKNKESVEYLMGLYNFYDNYQTISWRYSKHILILSPIIKFIEKFVINNIGIANLPLVVNILNILSDTRFVTIYTLISIVNLITVSAKSNLVEIIKPYLSNYNRDNLNQVFTNNQCKPNPIVIDDVSFVSDVFVEKLNNVKGSGYLPLCESLTVETFEFLYYLGSYSRCYNKNTARRYLSNLLHDKNFDNEGNEVNNLVKCFRKYSSKITIYDSYIGTIVLFLLSYITVTENDIKIINHVEDDIIFWKDKAADIYNNMKDFEKNNITGNEVVIARYNELSKSSYSIDHRVDLFD